LAINKDPKRTLGYVITVSLEIALDIKDLDLLKGLQAYFGVGGIYKHSGNMMRYKVSSARDLARVVIPHFEKYPLVTQKRADFEIFKSAIGILNSGGISSEELQKLVNLRASALPPLPSPSGLNTGGGGGRAGDYLLHSKLHFLILFLLKGDLFPLLHHFTPFGLLGLQTQRVTFILDLLKNLVVNWE